MGRISGGIGAVHIRSIAFVFLLALGVLASLRAQAPGVALTREGEGRALAELSARDAVVLGLVEGVTEFLPISSTGHLIIASHALGLEDETPFVTAGGAPVLHKGRPLTRKIAADTYTVIIQFGAIMAVVFLYWRQIVAMFLGLAGRNTAGFRLLRNVLIAVAPSAVIGLALQWCGVMDRLFSVRVVIGALLAGAVLMWVAERWRKGRQRAGLASSHDLDGLTARQALGIGFMQCLALWPGMSRSMVTIVGGYFCRLSPAKAAEFSFLAGLPTLGGAALLKSAGSGGAMIQVFGWSNMLLGCAVAAVAAFFAVKFLVGVLTRFGLEGFAVYRVALAVALGVWFWV